MGNRDSSTYQCAYCQKSFSPHGLLTLSEVDGVAYKRERLLGVGAYGKVYEVRDAVTGELRCVKELHKLKILQKGEEALDLTMKERKVITQVNGAPYVARCFGAFSDEQTLYLMMQCCTGGEMKVYLDREAPLLPDVIQNIMAQLVVGLEEIHKRFIVHRDIKPENILFDNEGYVCIIDFNMAARCDSMTSIVRNKKGISYGTLPYTCPELLNGGDHSSKADWWSLGIVLWEFCHGPGLRPFAACRGKGTVDIKTQLESMATTRLTDVMSSSLPATLKSLLKGLLKRDPKQRFGAEQIKSHPFFHGVNWEDVKNKKCKPIFTVDPDRFYFKAEASIEDLYPENLPQNSSEQSKFFGWNWTPSSGGGLSGSSRISSSTQSESLDDSGKPSPGRKRALAQENLLNIRGVEAGAGEGEEGAKTERTPDETKKESEQGRRVMQKQGRRMTLTTETPKPAHMQTKDKAAKRGSSSNPKSESGDKTSKSPGILKKFANTFTPAAAKSKDKTHLTSRSVPSSPSPASPSATPSASVSPSPSHSLTPSPSTSRSVLPTISSENQPFTEQRIVLVKKISRKTIPKAITEKEIKATENDSSTSEEKPED